MADSGRNAFSSWMNFAFRTVSPMDRRLYDFRPLLETLKNVKNRNFARKINASKRWIQRVIKKKKKKKKVRRPSFPAYPRCHESSFTNVPTILGLRIFESHFSHISTVRNDESEGTAIILWKNERDIEARSSENGRKIRKAFE